MMTENKIQLETEGSNEWGQQKERDTHLQSAFRVNEDHLACTATSVVFPAH
jgi:hypothetical protein